MRNAKSLLAAAVAALLGLLGCDEQRAAKLEEGLSSEADVRRQFGEPVVEYADPDGSRTLEYPRQPEGRTNLMVTIGADGRLSALRQVLKASEFEKIKAGLDKVKVRRTLGRPAKVQVYAMKPGEEWTWFWADGTAQKVFTVTFDADGHVQASAVSDDPRQNATSSQ